MRGTECPECAAAPRMDFVSMVPRPNSSADVRLECPACGHRTVVDQDDSDDAGGLW